jgi:hypothetical protein
MGCPTLAIHGYNGSVGSATVENCLFADNHTNGLVVTELAAAGWNIDVRNCTFADNSSRTMTVNFFGNGEMRNNIFHNNTAPYDLYLNCDSAQDHYTHLSYGNNCFDSAEDIASASASNVLTNLGGNIYADPLFTGGDPLNPETYYLQEDSPCIDTGFAYDGLPDFDIAGNPRIYGTNVDMGCYEWCGVTTDDDTAPLLPALTLSCSPNPFNPSTTIRYSLPEQGPVTLTVYNLRGQMVKTLVHEQLEASNHSVVWDGTDEHGRSVASGVYFYRVDVNGQSACHRCVLMK